MFFSYSFTARCLTSLSLGLMVLEFQAFAIAAPTPTTSSSPVPSLRVVVNSNQDGSIQPDDALTLREAIALTNSALLLNQLSQAEQAQVESLSSGSPSRIEFDLPSGQTTIGLREILPPLASPGLVVDGTTQPGYDTTNSATAEIKIPIPVVAIAPASDREVFRGLTVVADNITIKGLSLYGFSSRYRKTASTPAADIFIAHRLPPPDTSEQQIPNANFPFHHRDLPPQNVVIEDNWLGLPPDESVPSPRSDFGVSVFNGLDTTIRRNRIANHDGSGIITAVRADNLQIAQNIIVGNGLAGMPDGIRLEGVIRGSQITSNLICGNDGSSVFLFKPEGAVKIQDNQIKLNGRRFRRAAVYLMGNDHQVINNQIQDQTGPGVVVAAYPKSDRNLIANNRFANLEGLSIDLNTQQNVGVEDYQRGDGPNPERNSANRRQETGNSAINAPQFASPDFMVLNGKVNVDGQADPGTEVQLYRLEAKGEEQNFFAGYAPLREAIATVSADDQGRFGASFTNLKPGDRISAIATDSRYGTSEPAFNAVVRSLDSTLPESSAIAATDLPQCTTRPIAAQPPAPPEPVVAPEPIRLQVPKNIHFALDEATISPASATVLDQIAAVLQAYPFIVMDIEGHTDPRATDNYNLELGQRRALATRAYLLNQGVAPERITIRSLGEAQRQSSGTSRLDYARDRRAEFSFKDVRGVEIIFELQEADLQPESSSNP